MMLRLSLVLLATLVGACAPGLTDAGTSEHPPGRDTGAPPQAIAGTRSPHWTLTVYYTAVERFHTGRPMTVRGCPRLDCDHGDDDLGRFPTDFVTAVRDEGTGRTADGRYLNWSYDVGYWMDDTPRDSHGKALRPWRSAAADPQVMAFGTDFTIADCGTVEEHRPPPSAVCERLRAARWRIVDEFTPGLGGRQHLDLYIGEETGPGFTETDLYTTLSDAVLTVNHA